MQTDVSFVDISFLQPDKERAQLRGFMCLKACSFTAWQIWQVTGGSFLGW